MFSCINLIIVFVVVVDRPISCCRCIIEYFLLKIGDSSKNTHVCLCVCETLMSTDARDVHRGLVYWVRICVCGEAKNQ